MFHNMCTLSHTPIPDLAALSLARQVFERICVHRQPVGTQTPVHRDVE